MKTFVDSLRLSEVKRRGLVEGIVTGTLACALIGWATTAKLQLTRYPFGSLQLSEGAVVLGYAVVGALIGGLATIIRPLIKNVLHAAIAGIAIGTPIIGTGFFLVSVGQGEVASWRWSYFGAAVLSVFSGVGVYLVYTKWE